MRTFGFSHYSSDERYLSVFELTLWCSPTLTQVVRMSVAFAIWHHQVSNPLFRFSLVSRTSAWDSTCAVFHGAFPQCHQRPDQGSALFQFLCKSIQKPCDLANIFPLGPLSVFKEPCCHKSMNASSHELKIIAFIPSLDDDYLILIQSTIIPSTVFLILFGI